MPLMAAHRSWSSDLADHMPQELRVYEFWAASNEIPEPWLRRGLSLSAMYIDKLDGLQREIDRHEAAEQFYMDEDVQILELARYAQRLFEQQEPRQKRAPAQLRMIELLMGGWRSARNVPPTV